MAGRAEFDLHPERANKADERTPHADIIGSHKDRWGCLSLLVVKT
jgi:hypothetical protein